MLKKAMPLFLLSGLVLGGCYNNGAVPKHNETPMERVEDRTRDWTPNVRDERRGGTNVDGLDNGRDMNNNGVRNGIINDNNGVRDNVNNGNLPNETIIEENANPNRPNETIIEENNRNNRNNGNLNNR